MKKARRLISPTQIVSDAVQPKALKQVRRGVYRTVNPVEGIEGLAGDLATKARPKAGKRRKRKRPSVTQARQPASGNRDLILGLAVLVTVVVIFVGIVITLIAWVVSILM